VNTSGPILRVTGLRAGYLPGVDILRGIDLEAQAAAVTTVIGPNGAGKSTLLKAIFGLVPPRAGEVWFDGQFINGWQPHRCKLAGLAYVPQAGSTFPQLTVEENLRLGGWVLRSRPAELRRRLEWVYETFPVLADLRRARATLLSGGQLRMLAVAKELVVPPKALLVDEPTAGLAPKVAAEVYGLLTRLTGLGITVLLVDQNVVESVKIASGCYLVAEGRVIRSGSGRWFLENLQQIVTEMLRGRTEAPA
jgi:branched-chain amino acid transport system ATP-binding protein